MGPLSSLLAEQGDKHNAPELAILIALPLFFAFVLYRVAKARVARGGPRTLLWSALVPLLVGAWLAYTPFSDVRTKSYLDFHSVTPRSVTLHYASFFVPIAAALLVAGLILYGNYREKMEQ
jgi:hypothetical protein